MRQDTLLNIFKYLIIFLVWPPYIFGLQLTKCCNYDEVFDISMDSCTKKIVSNSKHPMDPAFAYFESEPLEDLDPSNYLTKREMVKCTQGSVLQRALNEIREEITDDADIYHFSIDYHHEGILYVDDGIHITHYTRYCIDRGFKENQFLGTLVMYCHVPSEVACKTSTCINACCGPNELYDVASHECIKQTIFRSSLSSSTISFEVSSRLLYEPTDLKIYDKISKNKLHRTNVLTLFEAPECMYNHGYHSYNFTDDTLIIYNSGELQLGEKVYDKSHYCLVHIEDDENGHHKYEANVCTKKSGPDKQHQMENSSGIVKPFSIPLWITLISYMI